MFCGVGNRGVEHQTDDRLAADILDADAYTGRIESNKLNRTSHGRSGPWTCGLRIGPGSGQQKGRISTAANCGIRVALEGKC